MVHKKTKKISIHCVLTETFRVKHYRWRCVQERPKIVVLVVNFATMIDLVNIQRSLWLSFGLSTRCANSNVVFFL